MSDEKTVLVLGAGSNVDFGFPSGAVLTRSIVQRLAVNSDSLLRKSIVRKFSPEFVAEFRLQLLQSQCPSIDSFLQNRPEYQSIGKHAIAAAILECERSTGGADFANARIPNLWRHDANRDTPSENWYSSLLQGIGDTPEAVRAMGIKIVTFNYDRSLERYLVTSLMARYRLSEVDAIKLIEPLGIVHAYGSVGPLFGAGPMRPIPYGIKVESFDYSVCADRIRVVDAREDDSIEFIEIRKSIATSRNVVFLGFGFDSVNLRRLFNFESVDTFNVSGTAFGLTNRERDQAIWEIGEYVLLNGGQLYNDSNRATALGFIRETGLFSRKTFHPKSHNGGTFSVGLR